MSDTMTDDDHTRAVRDAGLNGWKAVVRRNPTRGGYVAVLTSPDFNPLTDAGAMASATGNDQADAFARALEAAKGSIY